jgi:MFS superfamily sulfate permease-like transporter
LAQAVEVERPGFTVEADVADAANGHRRRYDAALATDPDVVIYRISGAFFFGAAATVAAALDRIGEQPKAYVIDFSAAIRDALTAQGVGSPRAQFTDTVADALASLRARSA